MCDYDSRCDCGEDDDDLVGHVLEHIAQGRWGVTGVYGDGFSPPFAYTTGLSGLARPELIIAGLDPPLAGRLLNTVAQRLLDEAGLGAGSRLRRVIQRFDVALVSVTDPRGIEGQIATRLVYGAVPSLQVVLPDARGRFPWSPGYDLPASIQPLWGSPRSSREG